MILEELIQLYKVEEGKLSEKEKAELEQDIIRHKNVPGNSDEWLCSKIGGSRYNIASRSLLIRMGNALSPLWERIDGPRDGTRDMGGDMLLRTAVQLARKAKDLSFKLHIPLERSLMMVLEEYNSYDRVSFLEGGKMVRIPSPAQKRRLNSGKPLKKQRETEEPDEDVTPDHSEIDDGPISEQVHNEDRFWKILRASVIEYLSKRLNDMDDMQRASVEKEIMAEFGVVIESVRIKLHNLTSRRKEKISFPDVVAACSVLAMSPPSPGDLPDLEEARSRKRKLAREYHPDTSGSDLMVEQFNLVLKAFDVIETFIRQQKYAETQSTKHSSVHSRRG